MRRISAPFFMALVVLFTSVNGTGVRGQDLPKAAVAVLDFGKVMRKSDAAKDISRQIKEFRDSFRDEIQADEIRLRQVETELKRQRSVLSPAVFEKRRQEFRNQVIAAQKRGQGHKRQLDRALKLAMDKIKAVVIPIVKELTENKGFTLVVEKSQVLFANRSLDVTDEVMRELNQKLRTVAVPKPQ